MFDLDPNQPLSDVEANDLILAIQNGEEPSAAWVKALARYAEAKADEVRDLQRAIRKAA